MNLYGFNAFQYSEPDGGSENDGSCDVPNILSGLTLSHKNRFTLAQNAIATLWNSTNGPSDFQYLRIKTDVGDTTNGLVMLELVTDSAAIIKLTPYTVGLLATKPFELWSSQSYANYTANFAGGTLSKINLIRAKNLNTTSANVSIWLFN